MDEMFGKPQKKVERRRQFSGVDQNGRQICTDPDGKLYPPKTKRI
jgi:hypothetical protein